MLNIGPGELLVILLIALLVVGPKKLPEISRSLGRALREFRRISSDAQAQLREVVPLDELNALRTLSGSDTAAVAPGSGPAATTPAIPNEPPAPVDLGPPGSSSASANGKPAAGDDDPGGRPVDLGPPPRA